MRSDQERLLDILEAIDKIEQFGDKDRASFEADEMLQVWMVHHLQTIGEAVTRLSQEIRDRHPEVAWGEIIGMRHVLVHGYFDIDLDIVWQAIEQDIQPLKLQVEVILRELGSDA